MILFNLITSAIREGGTKQQTCYLVIDEMFRWLETQRVPLDGRILDLGCGDERYTEKRRPDLNIYGSDLSVDGFDINTDNFFSLGKHDLVLCTNVYEHLWNGPRLISNVHTLLRPGGYFYLAWTNWLSPWGGHEFSPWHYLGKRRGRQHEVHRNLFITYIGQVIHLVRRNPNLTIKTMTCRYYPELGDIMKVPVLREFLAWNPTLLIQRT